jgi:Ethanolamine utilization protein, possible chaperonin
MALPTYVLEAIADGKEYLSNMNEDLREDFLRGCACKSENQKILERVLVALDGKVELDEFDDSVLANLRILYWIIGGGEIIKLDQTITFPTLPTNKQVGDVDFSPNATASSGLPVSYSSSNTAVATIVSGLIHIVGVGSTTITATQAGDGTYNAASPVGRSLTVANNVVVNFGFTDTNPDGNVTAVSLPSSLTISSGVSQYTINFTVSANLKYLVHREPISEPVKTVWINQIDYNYGVIPDSKYRAYVESGTYRYYYTRVLFPLYSGINTIQFKTA